MAQKIIVLMIAIAVLFSFLSYCFAEETQPARQFNPKKTGETLNLIAWIIILFGLAVALIGRIYDRRRRRKNYSHSGDDFGGDFTESSGGIYYGDGFRGISRRYFPGSGGSDRGRK